MQRPSLPRVAVVAVVFAFAAGAAAAQSPASRPAAAVVPRAVATAVAPTPTPAGGWWDDVFVEPNATLAEILAAPESFRGRIVRITVQFSRTAKLADAFHTGFTPDRWWNFSAWGDEAALEDPARYGGEHAFFFMRRDHVEAPTNAAQYERFLLRVRVAEVLQGAPWIEVLSAAPTPGRMTEAALLRLVKAEKLRAHRKFDAAAEEFAAADDPGLPEAVRLRTLRAAAECFRTAGRAADAALALKSALALKPGDEALARDYAAVRARLRGRAAEDAAAGERVASFVEKGRPASRPATDSRPRD